MFSHLIHSHYMKQEVTKINAGINSPQSDWDFNTHLLAFDRMRPKIIKSLRRSEHYNQSP